MAYRLGQFGFSGGMISPELEGRSDLEKYALSLRIAKNVLITKPGGVMNRAGAEFIGEVRDSSQQARIVGFQFNTTQAYVLEWGEQTMRPIMDAGQILETSVNITACTTASQGVFMATAHGYSVGNRVFLTGIAGLALSGVSQINGRVMIVGTVPTANTFTLTDLYGTAFSTATLTAYSAGGTVSRLYQIVFPYADTELFDVGFDQTADTMLLAHLGYAPRKLTRSGHANWTVSTIAFGPTQAAPTNPVATNTVGAGGTTYSYKITAIDEDTGEESLPTSAASTTNDLTVAGNYNTITWTGASGAERYIVYKAENGVYGLIGGTTGTSFIDDNILPDLGDTPPSARNPFGSSSNYPSVVSFHEGRSVWAQTTNIPGGVWMSVSNLYYNMNVSAPAKADDAVTFDLRPGVNAVQGLVSSKELIAFTSEREFTIKGGGVTEYITPASLVVKPHTQRGSKRIRPIKVGDITLHIQRQGAVVRAFGYSFEKDSNRSNDLTLLAPHLFAGHTIVDWCYQQDPDSIVWCVRDDGVVLSLTFVEDQNTFAWCDHYLGGTFGSGASATGFGVAESCCSIEGEAQDDVYFVVKRTVNSVTKRYIEKLAARWRASVDADGNVTNIEDAQFLDSFVAGTAASATAVISGLWHLEGQSVNALVAGNVHGPKTVSGGQIALDTAMAQDDVYCVGLAYVSDIVDLPVAQATQNGAALGRLKVVNKVVLKFKHSRGASYGSYTHQDRLTELAEAHFRDAWNDPIKPYSGDTLPLSVDGGWDMDASAMVRQTDPLPLEVLAICRDLTTGGP